VLLDYTWLCFAFLLYLLGYSAAGVFFMAVIGAHYIAWPKENLPSAAP
jgi:hypothetical protein